jgi:hypothetical protein
MTETPPATAPSQPDRRMLAAAGAAVALVAGVGGFAIGHATADDGPERPPFSRAGFEQDGPGGPPGMRGPDIVRPGTSDQGSAEDDPA